MIRFHDHVVHLHITNAKITFEHEGDAPLPAHVHGKRYEIPANEKVSIPLKL